MVGFLAGIGMAANIITPMIGLYAASRSAKAQKEQGAAALANARKQAYDTETARIFNKASAMQEQASRLQTLKSQTSTNIALFSTRGDLSSQSVQRFLERQREKVGSDLSDISTMAQAKDYEYRQQSRVVMEEGRARKSAANIGAFTSMATGIYQFSNTFTTG